VRQTSNLEASGFEMDETVSGSASHLLRADANPVGHGLSIGHADSPKTSRALEKPPNRRQDRQQVCGLCRDLAGV